MPETMLIRDQILETAKTIINGEREGTLGGEIQEKESK